MRQPYSKGNIKQCFLFGLKALLLHVHSIICVYFSLTFSVCRITKSLYCSPSASINYMRRPLASVMWQIRIEEMCDFHNCLRASMYLLLYDFKSHTQLPKQLLFYFCTLDLFTFHCYNRFLSQNEARGFLTKQQLGLRISYKAFNYSAGVGKQISLAQFISSIAHGESIKLKKIRFVKLRDASVVSYPRSSGGYGSNQQATTADITSYISVPNTQ